MAESIHERVNSFIGALKGIDWPKDYPDQDFDRQDTAVHIIREIFTTGNCGNFAIALSIAFPEAVLWFVVDVDEEPDGQRRQDMEHHVLVEIDNRLYDINGDVTSQYVKSKKTTAEEIIKGDRHDFFSNYSFKKRGPMV